MVLDRSNISGSLLFAALWLLMIVIYGILSFVLGAAFNVHMVNGIGLVLNIGVLVILYTICQTEKLIKRIALILGIVLTIVAFLISAMTMTTPFAFMSLYAVSMYVIIAIPLLLMGFALVRDMDSGYQWLGWLIIILSTIMTWVSVYFWAMPTIGIISIPIGQGILFLIAIGIIYFLYNRFCQINAGAFKISAFSHERNTDI